MKRSLYAAISTMTMIALLTACGSTGSGSTEASGGTPGTKKTEPVTLKIAIPAFANDEYDKVFSKVVAQKFPNITLDKIVWANMQKDLIATDVQPDIIMMGIGSTFTQPLKDTGLAYDMTELAKSNKLDLSRLSQAQVNLAKNNDGNPDLTVIPYQKDVGALYYNKDIFDRLGVEYPKDRMTWAQVTDLAKRLTRVVDGVQFRGLEPDAVTRSAGQLGLRIVDPKTNKSIVNTDGWKAVFTQLKNIYDIPGNSKFQWGAKAKGEFTKTKDLAMYAGLGPDGFDLIPDLNWDLVTLPVTDAKSNISQAFGGRGFAITSVSTHKEEAMQLIQWWFSDEVQKKLSAAGHAATLSTPDVQKAFGTDSPGFKGKHLEALFMLKDQETGTPSQYEVDASAFVRQAFQDMITKNEDVNTALRTADEKINNMIKDDQTK